MVSKGHHAQADGQGFILSQLYVTSYGEDLQTMMDEGEWYRLIYLNFTPSDSLE